MNDDSPKNIVTPDDQVRFDIAEFFLQREVGAEEEEEDFSKMKRETHGRDVKLFLGLTVVFGLHFYFNPELKLLSFLAFASMGVAFLYRYFAYLLVPSYESVSTERRGKNLDDVCRRFYQSVFVAIKEDDFVGKEDYVSRVIDIVAPQTRLNVGSKLMVSDLASSWWDVARPMAEDEEYTGKRRINEIRKTPSPTNDAIVAIQVEMGTPEDLITVDDIAIRYKGSWYLLSGGPTQGNLEKRYINELECVVHEGQFSFLPVLKKQEEPRSERVVRILEHAAGIDPTVMESKIIPGNTEQLKKLIQALGSNLSPNMLGLILSSAIQRNIANLYAVTEVLVEAGANIEKYKYGTLHLAACKGQKDIVQLLLKHGASLEDKAESNGDTPLIRAAGSGNLEMVRFLIELGANVDARNDKNETALNRLLKSYDISGQRQEEIALLLVRSGAHVESDVIKKAESRKFENLLNALKKQK